MAQNLEIDNVDREIISILIDDAKTPYTEIAKRIYVSAGTVHVRMRKLEHMGIVKGSTLVIDTARMGYDLTAYLGVYLSKGNIYDSVIKELEAIPQVIEAHYTTGVYSIFIKVLCRNTGELRDVLNDRIQAIEGIQRTETILSLEESIKRPISFDIK
ncbi:MAG: Lrp/AsnC ligand binding domain-containing protein [Flavobacteriales bacterium]|nr:Lrp/AsnC ligand binding domain-containing protein [Flavobacteriales bacterium]